MARGPKKMARDDEGGEVKEKDFKRAVSLYRNDIKAAASSVGEFAQEISTAYKEIKKACNIQPQAAKLAFKLDDMEEAKRDDFIRGFVGLCTELNIPLISNDLVDQAERAAAPTPKPKPTPPVESDGSETDLADEPFESSEAELAQQEGRATRRSTERATESLPASAAGTGAAARKAMNQAATAH